MRPFDLVVIGTGPGGQRAAIQASKIGKAVAVVEKQAMVGGVSINTGTIPSKTMREAVLHLSGFYDQAFYGANYHAKENVTMSDLNFRVNRVIENEAAVLQDQLRRNNVELLHGTASFTDTHHLRVENSTGFSELEAEYLVVATGTKPATNSKVAIIDRMKLAAAGIEADDRGRIKVDKDFRTNVAHIFAVGDVIGFPSLASVSMEQGRIAAARAFGLQMESDPEGYPYGIYTIPQISFIGKTEEQLTESDVPYEVGVAYYREIARGQISGHTDGRLKLLFHRETLELLGVHIFGEDATELLHIGQAVFLLKGKITYFVNTVFNYPTLAECYKAAAFNGLNRLR